MKEWGPAVREFDISHNTPAAQRAHLRKNLNQRKEQAEIVLQRIEAVRNRHVADCQACKDDGHQPNFDSTNRQFR